MSRGFYPQCYVLEDGTRVLSGRGMQEALGLGQAHGTLLRSFVGQKALKPYINNELAMELENPLRFIRPDRGGKPALAYEAMILPIKDDPPDYPKGETLGFLSSGGNL